MKTSILDELYIALNNYDSLDEEIKDLIAVHNSAVESDERACYLIMGKLVDMINWLYRLSGNFWLLSFKISYLCLPLFYETRTTPSCHPSGCAYRQL